MPHQTKWCPSCETALVATPLAGPDSEYYCDACDRAITSADLVSPLG